MRFYDIFFVHFAVTIKLRALLRRTYSKKLLAILVIVTIVSGSKRLVSRAV